MGAEVPPHGGVELLVVGEALEEVEGDDRLDVQVASFLTPFEAGHEADGPVLEVGVDVDEGTVRDIRTCRCVR